MRRCFTCKKAFPDAYALEYRRRPAFGDKVLECIDCCMEREEEEREGPEFPHYVGWDGREHAEY